MKKRIKQLLKRVEKAREDEGSYPFLPEIAQCLEVMSDSLSLSRERRSKMSGALERLVTEVYSFSESSLGEELLKLSDDFSKS